MECDICGLDGSKGRRMNCVTCARSALFDPRMELAARLFDKEEMARRVEAVVVGNTNINLPTAVLDGVVVDTRACIKTQAHLQTKAKLVRLHEDRKEMQKHEESLQKKLDDYKAQIQEMKTILARRRSDRESAGFELASRTSAEVEAIQKTTRKLVRKWDAKHQDFIRGRMSLCREAARLARLHKERFVKGNTIQEKFTIANRLSLPDLREMNKANPAELTAALNQVAYLVSRVCTYLAVRLPAELILPRPDQPHPIVFIPGPAFISTAMSGMSVNTSNTTLASGNGSTARPTRGRVLQLTVPLANLAKTDRVAFEMFVEGVTLLAWDIAWLCKTQGMRGLNDWTDICAIGKNLHNLLLADHRGAARIQREASSTTQTGSETADAVHSKQVPANYPARFGQLSHGTSHSFLGTHDGSLILRGWKLSYPSKYIMDKIKGHLVTEIQGAEWEVVQDKGWGRDGSSILHDDEEPVMVRQRDVNAGSKQNPNSGAKETDGWTQLDR